MKIGFVNFTPMVYDINTPHTQGLGGSESAMCYLAGELAQLGHQVVLFTREGRGEVIGGVVHQNDEVFKNKEALKEIEVLVIQNTAELGYVLKPNLSPSTKLIFWTQHAHDQLPITGPFADKKYIDVYDGFVFISHWQMQNYLMRFEISVEKCTILRNAVAPAFLDLFKNPGDILANKKKPVLAYTSTPFRGLEALLKIFPIIKKQVPDAELMVYSSMKVYQMDSEQEQNEYSGLYKTLAETEGVTYIGSLPQSDLAVAMKEVLILAYPNTFAETACISAMEAMAAGAHVVTTGMGAMPETVLPFGDLVPAGNEGQYINMFVEYVVGYIKKWQDNKEELQKTLGAQVLLMNKAYNWSLRATEWERYLKNLLSIL